MLNFQTARSALQAKDQILATYAMNELCDFCEKHIYNPWANRICFDRSVQDVNNSASMGCRTCAIFDAYLYPGLSSKRNDRTMARIALKVAPYDVTSFKNAGEEEPEEKPKADIELTFHLIPEKDIAPLTNNVRVSPDTESKSTFEQARAWLKTCTNNHDSCRPSSAYRGFHPTRLLQILEPGSDIPLKLCDSDMIPPDVAYATLSHCWGGKVPHTLMSSNIEDLIVHGVHESLLGRTFKDAVKVAHELGLRYLWIDSFCIIQDDSKDWLHESSQMHKVYGNSACNIAATSARDGSAGCFRRRNPSAIGPLKLEFANVEGRKTRVSSHMDEKHVSEDQDGNKILFLTDAEMWLSRFEQEPLNERAWVVQERMLSPRVLHYDRDQIAWECNQLTACERYPMGLGPLISKGSPLRRRLDPELRMAQEDEIPGFALQDIWKPVVEAYTLTAITKPIDRLIALYGVGIMIQEACGWEYVAGMFPGKNLVSQLLWRASGVGSAPRRPDKRIAPSWSWASIEGGASVMPQWREVGTGHDKVSAEELRETPFCRVTECMAPTSFDADDGRLSSHARLKLECYLLPMAFSRNNWAEMTMIKKWQRRNRDRQYNGNPNMDFCLTTDRNARKPKGGRTVKSTLQEILLNTLSLAMNRWTLSRRWFPFLEKWQKSTVHRPEKFAARIKYDVWDEFCDDSDLWLMPVYNFQHGVAYYFERLLYGSLEGLVLERGRIPKGDGTYETVFRRCGAFCVMPKKFDELGGFFYGREDVDNNMRSFWDGVLQFGDVTGVECVQSDGIYHPDFENWKEGIGTYKMRDNVPQYQITLV